jgi:uncharacterized membrane protein
MIESLPWLLLLAALIVAVGWYFRRGDGRSLADLSGFESVLLSVVLVLALFAVVQVIGALFGNP